MLSEKYIDDNYVYHVSDWKEDTIMYIIRKDGSSMVRLSWYYNDNSVYLSDLHVCEESRGKGYATELIKIAELVSLNRKCDVLLLMVDTGSWMYEWYKKLGFKPIGRKKERLMKKEFEYDNKKGV